MITVLQIVKLYTGAYPLFDEMFRLDPQRFRVVVCCLGGTGSGAHNLDGHVARIVYLSRRSAQMRWYNLPLLSEVGAIIDQKKVDIVCCQLHRTLPVGLGACLVARWRPALVSTIHAYCRHIACRGRGHPGEQPLVATGEGRHDTESLNFSTFNLDDDRVDLRRELFPEIDASFWFGTVGRLNSVKNQGRWSRLMRKYLGNYLKMIRD